MYLLKDVGEPNCYLGAKVGKYQFSDKIHMHGICLHN
jgi:hypothetical protein